MRPFTADNGVVQVPVAPRRVAAIAGAFQYLVQVGVKPVATTTYLDEVQQWYPPADRATYEATTKVGGPADIDYEALASTRPDLIVVNTPNFAWERLNTARLASIAPTVYLATVPPEWKTFSQRMADLVGAAGAFDESRVRYERRLEQLRAKYADVLGSTTFAVVNAWSNSPDATFTREYAGSYCASFATDAGLKIPGTSTTGQIMETVSPELLGDLGRYNAVIYPLDPDGSVKAAFVPIAESRQWKALVERLGGRALGVKCSSFLDYRSGVAYLDSLDQALSTMPRKG